MADAKSKPVADTKVTHVLPRGVLHSTVSGVELNDEQKQVIKSASGIDVDWLLFTQSTHAAARQNDLAALSLTRLTWCW